MSEAVKLFFYGGAPIIISVTFQVWSTYKQTNKNKDATQAIVIGFVIVAFYIFFLMILFGDLKQPLQALNNLFLQAVNIKILLLWTLFIALVPKFQKVISAKITRGKAIKKSSKPIHTSTRQTTRRRKPVFSDDLKTDLRQWDTIVGSPQISQIRGTPQPPSLLLEENAGDSRNSFIVARGINLLNAKVVCDAYFEHDSVLNIVFRASPNSLSEYYMARIDSRTGGSNGILKAERQQHWGYLVQPNKYVLNDRNWYHIELTFIGNRITLKIDSETIKLKDSSISVPGNIGMFNEVKRVFVSNFEIERL